ncbi:MAG TPA: ABC transporter ATP-binding protein [Burkholderiaceae bacterium]|nr:ABC transporter ATP-binding protein [Burkholderiaceae bacterium]
MNAILNAVGLHAPLPDPAPTASVRGLRIAYGTQRVLDGLDWELLPGQVVGLLGRNGAGKTSLLESLLGLRDAGAGEVRLFGRPLAQLDDALRARIGYVPQQSDLFEWLTPAQLLAYFKSFYPRWNDAKVEGLLSRWQIARDKPIAQLSGGEQQRLSIVRALAHEPDLLVLDEPVASLDPAGRRDFLRELVDQVLGRGTTVVFSTHILSDLERVAFNVAFLSEGRIALQAPLDELLETTRRIVGPTAEVQALVQRLGLAVLGRSALDGGREQVLARSASAAPLPTGAGALHVEPVTLEDLFFGLTR